MAVIRDRKATTGLTHIDARGRARMVDVSAKAVTERVAVATATLRMQPATLRRIRTGRIAKGKCWPLHVSLASWRRNAPPISFRSATRCPSKSHRSISPRAPPGGCRSRRWCDRQDRCRNGGARRGHWSCAHRLRHVQGRRPRHGDHGCLPAREARRTQRDMAAKKGVTGERVTGDRAGGEQVESAAGIAVLAPHRSPIAPIRLHLRSGKDHPVRLGHPWVFSGAIKDLDRRSSPAASRICTLPMAISSASPMSIRAARSRHGCLHGRSKR